MVCRMSLSNAEASQGKKKHNARPQSMQLYSVLRVAHLHPSHVVAPPVSLLLVLASACESWPRSLNASDWRLLARVEDCPPVELPRDFMVVALSLPSAEFSHCKADLAPVIARGLCADHFPLVRVFNLSGPLNRDRQYYLSDTSV